MRITEEELIKIYGKERVADAKEKFKNATIQNDFIFYHVVRKKELCEKLLRLILKQELYIEDSTPQSTLSTQMESKTARLDVLATDTQGNHYDIEMQMAGGDSIPKRMRMYQRAIDSAFFSKSMQYKDATNTIIIFICKHDPIGFGLPMYTFKNLCVEDTKIELEDGTLKIILVPSRWDKIQDKDLKYFLKYVYTGKVSDLFTKELDMFVSELKYDEVVSADCFSLLLRLEDEKEIGIKQGWQEGLQKGLQKGWQEGEEAEKIATAKRMRAKDCDINFIAEMTGLSHEEIENL